MADIRTEWFDEFDHGTFMGPLWKWMVSISPINNIRLEALGQVESLDICFNLQAPRRISPPFLEGPFISGSSYYSIILQFSIGSPWISPGRIQFPGPRHGAWTAEGQHFGSEVGTQRISVREMIRTDVATSVRFACRKTTKKLDAGWPESVEEQGLLLLVLRHYITRQYIKDIL